jgi:2-oxoglutarate dehydrogenase N-terminus
MSPEETCRRGDARARADIEAFEMISRDNADCLEQLYQQYQKDPRSLDAQWMTFFVGFDLGYGQPAPSIIPADGAQATVARAPRGGRFHQRSHARVFYVVHALGIRRGMPDDKDGLSPPDARLFERRDIFGGPFLIRLEGKWRGARALFGRGQLHVDEPDGRASRVRTWNPHGAELKVS